MADPVQLAQGLHSQSLAEQTVRCSNEQPEEIVVIVAVTVSARRRIEPALLAKAMGPITCRLE
jgi:hypothetical protein